jgi:hypothetical protein
MHFQHLLKNERWETVYKDSDTNKKFNSFLFTLLNIFDASFQMKYKSIGKLRNDWITQGIKISCKCKGVYIPTAGTAMTQIQEHFTLSTVKS